MKVISSMATRHVLAELVPAVELESIGGVDAARRVAAGEQWDVVVLASDALARLADAGHVGPATPFALSQTAVAIASPGAGPAVRPSGAAFASVDELRAALRDARSIGYSTGPSGTALVRMISDWGIDDEVGELIQARPGIPVAASLAAGDVELGFQQLSELVGHPGIEILGVMPAGATIDTVFSAAVATETADADAAADLVGFLTSDAAVATVLAHNFGLPTP